MAGTPRSLFATSAIVGDEQSWELRIEGLPGDQVYLAASRWNDFRSSTRPPGVWLVRYPALMRRQPDAVLPGSGVLDFTLPAPDLAAGAAGGSTIVQAFVLDAAGAPALGGSVHLHALDQDGLPDCNANGILDILDLMAGFGIDCDDDLQMDACQFLPDCNGNGIGDGLDIDCGASQDENENGVPDECELTIRYVDVNAPAGGDGSFEAPFRSLAEAFAVALDGDSVRVFDGVYTGPQNRRLRFGGRSLDVASLGGPNSCILDCGGIARAFEAGPGNPPIRIAGFTIRNGYDDIQGGGALLRGTAALVEDCVFRFCTAYYSGGAMSAEGALTLDECTFGRNEVDASQGDGGAVSVLTGASSFAVRRCIFDFNTASRAGAISVACSGERCDVRHSIFRGNSASNSGGAMSVDAYVFTETTIDDSLFWGNTSTRGGALFLGSGSIRIQSSTFVANDGSQGTGDWEGGGAMFLSSGTDVELRNAILWDNVAALGSQVRLVGTAGDESLLDVAYCDLEGGLSAIDSTYGIVTWGPGNLETVPLLEFPAVGDYRLGPGSPCVDAGDDSALALDVLDIDADGDVDEPVPLDLLLQPRRIDDPAVVDTGAGSAPLTDMGALERQ